MGFFRRLKPSQASAEECRQICKRFIEQMQHSSNLKNLEDLAESWAVHRELLARYEEDTQGADLTMKVENKKQIEGGD